jgi:hypothetical protein
MGSGGTCSPGGRDIESNGGREEAEVWKEEAE